jgi:hypothetical protein
MLAVLSDAVVIAIGVIAMESLCYSQLTPLKLVLALVSVVCYRGKRKITDREAIGSLLYAESTEGESSGTTLSALPRG